MHVFLEACIRAYMCAWMYTWVHVCGRREGSEPRESRSPPKWLAPPMCHLGMVFKHGVGAGSRILVKLNKNDIAWVA